MFDYDIMEKKHFTGKDGQESYDAWMKRIGLDTGDFPFRVKTGRFNKAGRAVNMNVVSWGLYQGSDWRWYIFISYRTNDNKLTCAYHWDVDSDGMPIGQPRKHQWNN